MKYLVVLLTLLYAVGQGAVVVQAQGRFNQGMCQFADGQTYFLRYEEGQIHLLSWNTGEVVSVLAENIQTDLFDIRQWSSDCRYVVVGLGQYRDQLTLAWEITPPAARLIGQLDHVTESGLLRWSPDDQYLLLDTSEGFRLWHLPSNRVLPFPADDLTNLMWDVAHQTLWGVPTDHNNRVWQIDLSSGQVVGDYHIGDRRGGTRGVDYLIRGEYMLVAADHYNSGGAALWNLTTGWNMQIEGPIRPNGQLRLWSFGYDFAISPDGRWLAVSQGGGHIFLMDLTLPQGDGPRPFDTHIHRPGIINNYLHLRFTSPTILEGAKLPHDIEIYRWDITTQSALYYDILDHDTCQDSAFIAGYPESALLGWACGIFTNGRE